MHILKCFKSIILVPAMNIFCFALPVKKMNNATIFNKVLSHLVLLTGEYLMSG